MFSKNRIAGLVFAITLIFVLSISTAVASSVTLVQSPQVVSAGDTLVVDVFVEPDVEIAGMQFDLEFDESEMHVADITEGELFKQAGMSTYFNAGIKEPGSLRNVYGTILGASSVSTPHAFATIRMVVDSPDKSTSILNLKNVVISDPNGNAVEFEVTGANIDVVDLYDINGDGVVDLTDSKLVEQHFSESTFYPYPRWDVNSDDIVDILDLTLVAINQD